MSFDAVFRYRQSDDPGAVGPGVYWVDTSGEPYILKIRSDADDDWITLGASPSGAGVIESILDTSSIDLAISGTQLSASIIDSYVLGIVGADLVDDFAAKAPLVHTHDDRYYTEAEIDTALSGKSAVGHTHDDRYYTEAEVATLIAASQYTDEMARDAIGSTLVAGRNIYAVEVDDGSNTITIVGKQYPGYLTSGRVFTLQNQYNFGSLSGQVLVANRCYYVPIYIGDVSNASVNAIVTNITANVTGDFQVGLYNADQSTLLPTTRIVQNAKASVSATGPQIFTIAAQAVTRHQWYNVAIASVTARSINGTNDEDQIPAVRGGMDTSFSKPGIMSFENLGAGWSSLPATASPSTQNALWLQIGARQGI